MKHKLSILLLCAAPWFVGCGEQAGSDTSAAATATTVETHSQSGVADSTSAPDVVKVAMKSPDHTTLVAAVKQADLVNALSNAGPFTVFAPTNAAFDKLPKGTVETLMKPEKKNDLIDVLQYNVYVGVLKLDQLQDGQTLGMVNGGNVKVTMENGKPVLNGKVHILGTVPASNGIIYVTDEVLVPQK